MRVLFVTPFYAESFTMGGMAIAPALWAQTLVSCGIEVDVFTTTANGMHDLDVPLGIPIEYNGVSVTYFPRLRLSGNIFFSLPLFLECRLAIPNYDIVHSVGLWSFPSIISSLIARYSGIPYIISLHGTLMPWAYNRHGIRKKFLIKLVERKRIVGASSIICTSHLERRYFQQFGFGEAAIIPNVVSTPEIDVDEARIRFRLRFNLGDSTILLFAGRLVQNKGVCLTISAFKQISDKFPKAKLVIVGPFEDDSGRLAQKHVVDLKLDSRVLFLGLQKGDDYWDAIAGADLFVLNSYSENFGMAPAEALSLGVPVLVSDHVGIADLVHQYNAGEISDLDESAIADAMANLIVDKNNMTMMGRNGIRLVQDHFSPVAVGQKFVDYLAAFQRT